MYIAEISPARYRGRLVAVTQFNIVLGILLAFFSNFVIAWFQLGEDQWRWMFGVEAVPAAAFYFLLFGVPFSPRWLVAQNRLTEASQVLARLGMPEEMIAEEIGVIQSSLDLSHHGRESLFRWEYRRPVLLAVAIATFNQLSGINAVMYYAPDIFELAGAGKESALLQAVAVGGTNMVFTMLALAIIDHFGRRNLMIAGSLGYIVSLSATAWAFYSYGAAFSAVAEGATLSAEAAAEASRGSLLVLVGLLVFIASHAFGQGAVIWVFISEIFPNRLAPGAGTRQLRPLVHGRPHLVDLPHDCLRIGWARLRLLRRHDGAATRVGAAGDARDQRHLAGTDPARVPDRIRPLV